MFTMKKTFLTDNEKHILIVLQNADDYESQRAEFNLNDKDFDMSVRTLIARKMVESYTETHEVGFLSCQLTPVGMAYLQFNPSLEHPKTEEEIKAENAQDKTDARRWELRLNTINWSITIVSSIISAALGYLLGKFF